MRRIFLVFCLGIVLVVLDVTVDVQTQSIYYLLVIGVDSEKEGQEDVFAEESEYLRDVLVSKLDNVVEKTYLRKEATREHCLDGLNWISHIPTKNDVVIIYISTHGRDDENFSFRAYDKRVSSQEIIARLSKLRCKTLLMVDTCKSGAMVRDWHNCANNVSIIASCQEDQCAAVWKFTTCFVDALKEADYDHDNKVDLNEFETYLPYKLKQIGSHQIPVYSKTKLNLVLAHK